MIINQQEYDKLSNGSNKRVQIQCDYCGSLLFSTKKSIIKSYQVILKDCCGKCKYKKRTEVSLKRDGVSNSAQRANVKNKIKQSNIIRLQSEEYKKQIKQTMLAKYGEESAMHVEKFVDKQRRSTKERYGVDNISQHQESRELATQNMIKTKIRNGSIVLYDGKTRPEIAKEQGFSRSHFGKLVIKYGYDKAIQMTPHETNIERIFREWLDEEKTPYEKQFRVNSKIADFKVGNLLIEVDGLYWHSTAAKLKNNYHAEKRQIYIDAGFTPLFFREHEILHKFEIVKSIVCNKLNKCGRIFARKCELREVDKKIGRDFFNNNHLMGNGKGRIFGLYYQGELASAISIKQIQTGHEVSRFCHKLNTNVVGGFSRLLKYARAQLNFSCLTTFIDLRYGVGSYLIDLGFTQEKTYLSFKWTDGTNVFNRMKFPGRSGFDIGLERIYDCGQAKFMYFGV